VQYPQSEIAAMDSIADALVYAVTHINCRNAGDEDLANEDDSAVGHIMAYLSEATLGEKNALADAAKRALAEEQSLYTPRQEMIDHFATWMEDIFGRDWNGNDQI